MTVSLGYQNRFVPAATKATASLYSIELADGVNQPGGTDGYGCFVTKSGYTIDASFAGFHKPGGCYGLMYNTSYFYNVTPISGLVSLSLTLKSASSLTVFYDTAKAGETNSIVYTDVSSVSCNFGAAGPDYFKVVADAEVTITKGTIAYTCSSTTLVNFGSYPQNQVSDSALLSSLNSSAGTPSSPGEGITWNDYKYYWGTGTDGSEKDSTVDIMKYADVTYDGSMYRGVYIYAYRPRLTYLSPGITSDSYQYTNGYVITDPSTTYWFKYEPISWRIVSADVANNKVMLLATSIIDAQDYYYSSGNRTIDSNTILANNYQYSHIRSWLNGYTDITKVTNQYSFLATAFSVAEKEKIVSTNIDGNESMNDKVFYLSLDEAKDSGTLNLTKTIRARQPSAYAKCQGAKLSTVTGYTSNGFWGFRTPYSYSETGCLSVNEAGTCGNSTSFSVQSTGLGVVPALWKSL